MAATLIEVKNLSKSSRQGFWMKRVEAVRSISFQVSAGDIFGFLGPNGAGKTTTIKVLTGLIRPSGGSAKLFGLDVSQARARRQLGYLPENPYIYPYLSAREFVVLCGRLSGLSYRACRDRAAQVLEQVGIAYAADRPVRHLSKGMLQRAGLAAALVADPELLILDEPMSGLDPIGRKEVRDLIVDERRAGRTIFFSTHILGDVEMLCDQVVILRRGRVVVQGALNELLKRDVSRTDVVILDPDSKLDAECTAAGHQCHRVRERLSIEVLGDEPLKQLLESALSRGLAVAEVVPRHETLEDLFVREAIEGEEPEG